MNDKRMSVIIVAAGKGSRMGGDIAKQFMPLCSEVVLMYTMRRFFEVDAVKEIVLVLSGEAVLFWEELCRRYKFDIPHKIAIGGATRFDSVRNGITLCTDSCDYIAVHDAVRPNISKELIERVLKDAVCYGNGIASMPVIDSLRMIKDYDDTISVNRDMFRMIQTPQIFKSDILRAAYRQPFDDMFTDDASVVEQMGEKIHLSCGDYDNIKITTPKDMILMEYLLDKNNGIYEK